MRVRNLTTGGVHELGPVSKAGGEAFIHPVVGDPSVFAKVYRNPSRQQADKLTCMLENVPKNPTEGHNHRAYAWPTGLIGADKTGDVIGFIMPRVSDMKEIFEFYNPAQRRKTCAHFNYRYLLQTARNVAGIMHELHASHYVIGDVNQKNMLVSDAALVTVLDTDSFQIRDPKTNVLHLCRVKSYGFTAPEVAVKKDVERTVEQDLFGLGVLVFHLLMEGVHPFQCIYEGPDDRDISLQDNVKEGRFPYGHLKNSFVPMPTAPAFEMLNHDIRMMFVRCFVDGHGAPTARPSAKEWRKVLSQAAKELKVCPQNAHHYYGAHLGVECPWCDRVRKGLKDSFPEKLAPVIAKPPRAKSAAAAKQPRTQYRSPAPPAPPPLPPPPFLSRSTVSSEPGFFASHKLAVTAVLAIMIILFLLSLQ